MNNQKGNSHFSKRLDKNTQPKNSDMDNLDFRVEEILAILDINTEVPDDLIETVIKEKESVHIEKPIKFDFSKYLQIAAVFAAAVLIGVLMGKNADINSFNLKQNREKQTLIELRERYHLSDKSSFYRF